MDTVPEAGKFYWLRYVGRDLGLCGAPLIVGTFRAAPYNQPIRYGSWYVAAGRSEGFPFDDFEIVEGPLVPPAVR